MSVFCFCPGQALTDRGENNPSGGATFLIALPAS
jgi:hypothetical protein